MFIKNYKPEYIRNFIFGAEDSLISTVGVLFGIAASGNYSGPQILVAGVVLVMVEALSMGMGVFLTEESIHEVSSAKRLSDKPWVDGILMFISYAFFGFLVIVPYIFFTHGMAKYVSFLFSVTLLFFVGYLPKKRIKSGLRTVVIASFASLVGYLVSQTVKF